MLIIEFVVCSGVESDCIIFLCLYPPHLQTWDGTNTGNKFQYNALQHNTAVNYDLSNKHIVELTGRLNVQCVPNLLFSVVVCVPTCEIVTSRQ